MKFKSTPVFYSIILILIFWQGLAVLVGYPELFPSVTGLIGELFSMASNVEFYFTLWHTIIRGLAGFLIAFFLSITFAAIALHNSFWKSFFQPWVVVMRSIPVISIVLIALLWLSPPGLPVFIAFFTIFPVLYQNMLSGLEHTDIKLVEMAKVFRKSNWQRLLYIYIPSAHSYIFSGMATALGFGWRAVIIGEVFAGPVHGIGTSMKKAQTFINMRELLAWTVIAIVVSFIFDMLLKLLSKQRVKLRLSIIKQHIQPNIITADKKELSIKLLNKSFNSKIVFKNFSTTLSNEHVNLLKTASGSGKTTLMHILTGILKKDSGVIDFSHTEAVIAYAFQDKRLISWLSVEQNIAFVLPHFPTITLKEKNRIDKLIHALELDNQQDKLPDTLSGGEQQRVALARALVLPCHVLLLDEPLTGLGQALKIKIIRKIEEFTKGYNPLIVWATHEEVENYLEESTNPIKFEQ
ncbi:MAG: ATP-binding cassette domain-containing protein [Paludibacter sp.]|nr:ATP-binding cassette domain-containing protein [Paludibacter sp.]MDD4199560.1 ATP-binding cassette domain-containing protein [Paludibacter sp.]MDD4427490.1 ATP-binding cassette domain-containing protein [Paludibacter sp.]